MKCWDGTVVVKSQLLYSDFDKTAYICQIDLIENNSDPKDALNKSVKWLKHNSYLKGDGE